MRTIAFLLLWAPASLLLAQSPPDSIPVIRIADTSFLGAPLSYPALETLFAAVDSFFAQDCAARLQDFKESKRGEWLQWAPQLSVGYLPALYPGQKDRIRPSVSYSLSGVERNIRRREDNKLKRLAIADQCAVAARKEKEKVWEMYQRRSLLLEQIEHQKEVFAIDAQLYAFYTEEFKQVKIPADFYLNEKRKYMDRQYALRQAEIVIRTLEAEILAAAHFVPLLSNGM